MAVNYDAQLVTRWAIPCLRKFAARIGRRQTCSGKLISIPLRGWDHLRRGGHYAMGVRFLRRGLPVIGPGGCVLMGVHFRRDRTRVTDARTSPTGSELGRPRLALTSWHNISADLSGAWLGSPKDECIFSSFTEWKWLWQYRVEETFFMEIQSERALGKVRRGICE